MTPHELRLAIDAHYDRMQWEREQAIIQAYYTAIWARWVKKPPKIMQILEKLRPRKYIQMTPEQFLQVLKRRQEEEGK